jgi:hypothetical protein
MGQGSGVRLGGNFERLLSAAISPVVGCRGLSLRDVGGSLKGILSTARLFEALIL